MFWGAIFAVILGSVGGQPVPSAKKLKKANLA